MKFKYLQFRKAINTASFILLLCVIGTTNTYAQGNHSYVDLGLPSGTLWATCNVGADAPEEYGDYFAWGETQPKTNYDWSTYQYCNGSNNTLTKYCNDLSYGYNGFTDDLTILLPEDDAAMANWGVDWHLPTSVDWVELYQNTTHSWTTQNGVNGCLFTASNGNSLFLPAAASFGNSYVGNIGLYWSSSLYTYEPYCANRFSFDMETYLLIGNNRCNGIPVRPVRSALQNDTPIGAINGKFTINANGDQVYFSQGNLQYQASTNIWRFAENQWDYVGEDNANISPTYDGIIDLFGWGTSGYHDANDPYNVNYMPWASVAEVVNPDNNTNGYGPSMNMPSPNLTGSSANYDWGVYNAISNGGNQTNQWRTLSIQEWNYVFNTRTTTSGIRYAKAKVNNINGVILLPDDWSINTFSLYNTNDSGVSFSSNAISTSQWNNLENAGAVFLPASGYRGTTLAGPNITTVYESGNQGFYLSSSCFDSNQAHLVWFYDGVIDAVGHSGRYVGHSVRLVCPVPTITSYSIDAAPNPAEGGSVAGMGIYEEGTSCTLTATPASGYIFISWTENNEVVSTDATYSFTVTGDRTLTANFGTLTNHWTTSNFKNYKPVKGIILIDGVEQFSNLLEIGAFCGDECRASGLATLFPITQQYVVNLSIGSDLDSPNEQITFRIYDHALQQELDIQSLNDMTLTDFNPIGTLNNWYTFAFSHEVTLSVSVTPEGAGTVTGAGSYLPDTEVTLEATANAGYAFKRWSQNGQTVSEANPYVFTLTGNMELTAEFDHQQQNALSTGWSWWSTYIDVDGADGLAMLENSLGHNGVMIMAQGQNTENYYSQVGYDFWWGDLTELHVEKGYKILASASCDAVMTGACANPENHPITISQNWNWIGYPCQTQQPVASATFQPSNEDIIMGQGPTSTYYEGYGWWPDFDMEPGKAYLYYSTSATTKQMVFHESRESNQDATEPTRDNHWTARNFKNYKPVKGIILIDGVEQFSNTLEIGAFCGDECRASSLATLFPITQQYVVNLSIGSDLDSPNEQITFRIYDHAQQQELELQSLNDMTLTDFNPIGSMNNWYQFGFATPEVTFTLPITGYGTSTGGYYLIAPPIDDVNPADIEGMTDGDFDLYYFDQAQELEWVNYKAEPFNLESGKGYLYAHKTDVTLTFTGAPYSGNGQVPLAYTAGNPLAGWNLVGNPFGQTAYLADGRDFYVMKGDGSEIIPAVTNDIQPMQGVFVVTANANDNTVTFTTEMPAGDGRALAIEIGKDRSVSPIDRAIVRFGEGRTLPKFMLNGNHAKVYIPQNSTDYAVVRSDCDSEMPVNFKAVENGTYTFSVDAKDVELDYLHLIDHITGADIDLLQQPSYTFQATGSEYEARFMLVFKVETGIGENMQETFCYAKDGVLYINAETENATLQIVDAMGRIVYCRDGACTVSTTGMASGVYMLRLINGDGVKTQKIVIK